MASHYGLFLTTSAVIGLGAVALGQSGGPYLADLGAIRTAMEIFYIDSGRFTTIENLDDTISGTPLRPWNAINDGGGAITVIPGEGFLRRQFIANWNGPYLTFPSQRRVEEADDDYDIGAPFDLNGLSSIYFYTPLGLLEPSNNDVSLRYYGDDFDQYVIVTHGANGRFDGNLTRNVAGDDIGILIPGFQVTVPAVSSSRIAPAATKSADPWELTVRGYNLGAGSGANGAVLINGTADGELIEWAPTLIRVGLAIPPQPGSEVQVRLSGGALALRTVTITGEVPELSVTGWHLYD